MDRNPYDNSIDWLQPQSPVSKQESIYRNQQQRAAQFQTQATAQKAASTKQARMPKQKALELVSSLKKGIIVSSVMGFGLFGFLAIGHPVGTIAHTSNTTTPITSSSSSSSTTPSNSDNSSSSNGSSSSTSQGGFSFGSSSSQSSVSSTSVS